MGAVDSKFFMDYTAMLYEARAIDHEQRDLILKRLSELGAVEAGHVIRHQLEMEEKGIDPRA